MCWEEGKEKQRKRPGGQAGRHRKKEAVWSLNAVLTQQSATGKGARREKGPQQGTADGLGQGQRMNRKGIGMGEGPGCPGFVIFQIKDIRTSLAFPCITDELQAMTMRRSIRAKRLSNTRRARFCVILGLGGAGRPLT